MHSKLIGTWDLESSDNFDEYMKELGVGFILRKTANSIKPTSIVAFDGAKWSIKLQSTFKNSETIFEDGVPFDEETLDGRKSKVLLLKERKKKRK